MAVAILDGSSVLQDCLVETIPLIPIPPVTASNHIPHRPSQQHSQASVLSRHVQSPSISLGGQQGESDAYAILRSDSLMTRAHTAPSLEQFSPSLSARELAGQERLGICRKKSVEVMREGDRKRARLALHRRIQKEEKCRLVRLALCPLQHCASVREEYCGVNRSDDYLPPSVLELLVPDPSLELTTNLCERVSHAEPPPLHHVHYATLWAVFARTSVQEGSDQCQEKEACHIYVKIPNETMSTLLGNIPAALVWHCNMTRNGDSSLGANARDSDTRVKFDYCGAAERVYQAIRQYTHPSNSGDGDLRTDGTALSHCFDIAYYEQSQEVETAERRENYHKWFELVNMKERCADLNL